MTPSRSSPVFLLFRLRNLALRLLPSVLQSALQYFSLNHPRNLRLQTRHVLRTFWSVVSKGLFLAFLLSQCLLSYPSTGIKSNCTDTAISRPVRACLCLLLPLDSAV